MVHDRNVIVRFRLFIKIFTKKTLGIVIQWSFRIKITRPLTRAFCLRAVVSYTELFCVHPLVCHSRLAFSRMQPYFRD